MRAVTRLSVLATLAIAALATMSAPAVATTITSNGSPYSGPIEGDEDGPTLFYDHSSQISGTCDQSDFSGVIEPDGTGQITSWTFEDCDTGHYFYVSVEDLPYDFEVEHTTGDAGTLTITSPVTMDFVGGHFRNCSTTAAAGATQAEVNPNPWSWDMKFEWQTLEGPHPLLCHVVNWEVSYHFTAPGDLHIEP